MQAGQRLIGKDGVHEVCLYPQTIAGITQSYAGNTSHNCSPVGITNTGLWDVNITSGVRTPIYAPFSGTVVKQVGIGGGYQTWINSDDKVYLANGTLIEACFSFGHCNKSGDNDITFPHTVNGTTYYAKCYFGDVSSANMKVSEGSHVTQGQLIGYTGNANPPSWDSNTSCSPSISIHSHWLLSKKHITSGFTDTCRSAWGNIYYSKNPIDIDDMFYVNGTTVRTTSIDGLTLNWKTYTGGDTPDPDPTPEPEPEPTTWTVTLYVTPDGAGYCTGAGTYEDGQEATLEAFANKGYEFVSWNDGYNNPLRYWTITNNLTLTAIFKKKDNLKGTLQDTFIIKALKVIHGDYGTGKTRKAKLGSDYYQVQKIVNYLIAYYTLYDRVAMMCWIGLYGNGITRKRKLTSLGYNYTKVQTYVKKYNKTKIVVKY